MLIQSPSWKVWPLMVNDLGIIVDSDGVVVAAAGDAAGAHAAGDNSSVAGHAAADGQDALRDLHAHDVLGAGLQTDQDDLLQASSLTSSSASSAEKTTLAAGSSRRSGQALADGLGGLQGRRHRTAGAAGCRAAWARRAAAASSSVIMPSSTRSHGDLQSGLARCACRYGSAA